MIDLSIRDLVYFALLLVSVVMAYSRLHAEIRHLEDTKSERRELDQQSREHRAMIAEIRMDIARLAEIVQYSVKRPFPPER